MTELTVPETPETRHLVRVLLVDDQRMVGEAVRRMLADEDWLEYSYCQKPEEAIALEKRRRRYFWIHGQS